MEERMGRIRRIETDFFCPSVGNRRCNDSYRVARRFENNFKIIDNQIITYYNKVVEVATSTTFTVENVF